MNRIISILLLLTLFACKKENISEPSYISIESIYLDSTTTSNITDAWVYIDDNLQGIYELPANFPVLASGVHKLRVKAGIKDNGIASSRIAYPFYSSYIIDEQNFDARTTIEIIPEVNYLDSAKFFTEDFDGSGLSLDTDSASFSTDETDGIDGEYGKIILIDSMLISEITTYKLDNLPQAGAPVYLELDYKCNTQFLVGVYVNFPGSVLQKDLLWVNPKEDWNKIYIDLTSTITEGVGAESFKVFIGMKRDFELDTNTLYFDNLKVVY
jgi:hypothetical protein